MSDPIDDSLPDTPVTATYDAAVTTTIRGWVIAFLVLLAFLGVAGVFIAASGEYICFDRSPWWGPPEDPTSTCAGHLYETRHHAPFPKR